MDPAQWAVPRAYPSRWWHLPKCETGPGMLKVAMMDDLSMMYDACFWNMYIHLFVLKNNNIFQDMYIYIWYLSIFISYVSESQLRFDIGFMAEFPPGLRGKFVWCLAVRAALGRPPSLGCLAHGPGEVASWEMTIKEYIRCMQCMGKYINVYMSMYIYI